jgi:hypothetical protein
MPAPMSTEQANAVYDILVKHCGASGHSDEKADFAFLETSRVVHEYRFQGALGFGGKFWRTTGVHREDPDLRWSVSCYPEDLTPERQEMIDAANTALDELRDGQ